MVPTEELTILEALINIRNRLTRLKKDRTEYIRAKDVLDIYSSLMNEVTRLNDIRTPSTPKASTSTSPSELTSTTAASTPEKPTEENRVDTILGDVFQLLSLFFLTIGKSRESPATFCQLATMKRLLTHLNESGIYTELDLKPFQGRLQELKEIITSGHSFESNLSSRGNSEGNEEVREDREEGLTKLLLAKWDDCERLLNKLVSSLDQLSPELAPIHQRLITLRRLLASIASRPRPTSKDTLNILTELRAIEDRRVNGKFVVELPKPVLKTEGAGGGGDDDDDDDEAKTPTLLSANLNSLSLGSMAQIFTPAPSSVTHAAFPPAAPSIHIPSPSSTTPTTPNPASLPSSIVSTPLVSDNESSSSSDEEDSPKTYAPPLGQELLAGLLNFNFELCTEIQAKEGAEDLARGPLQPIYDRLSELRAQLERLVLTHRWSLRSTDLYNYQMTLQEIDGMRKNGKWVDTEGNKPEGQLVLLYLLRRCYGLCYRLMASSEPVSEELVPIANKLTTVKRCLVEVQKYGGPYSGRDLYPYQLALAQIDDLRIDGRFQGTDGSTPEGQAILNALLSECHETLASMKEEGME